MDSRGLPVESQSTRAPRSDPSSLLDGRPWRQGRRIRVEGPFSAAAPLGRGVAVHVVPSLGKRRSGAFQSRFGPDRPSARPLGLAPGLPDPGMCRGPRQWRLRAKKRDFENRPVGRPPRRGSVGADGPEAVGAVDRSVHPRPERHLRLVSARRTDDREVLPVGPLDAPLVPTRATDVAHVVPALTRRSPAGAATRAALGIRCEPLLSVVLLIGGGMDEVDSTVDAVDRPISVGHGAPPGRVGRRDAPAEGGPIGGRESARSGARSRAPATQVPMWSPCCGAHRFGSAGQDTTGPKIGHRTPRAGWRA